MAEVFENTDGQVTSTPMANEVESEDFEDWSICKTQRGYQPSLGVPPTQASEPSGFDSIMVGYGTIIPRWVTPLQIQYWIDRKTFEYDSDADDVAKLLLEGASQWNGVGLGVTFVETKDWEKAHFDVAYDSDPKETASASSFFPHEAGTFNFYRDAFTNPATMKQILNTVVHEFGHILGLRHEHAMYDGSKEKDTKAVLFFRENADSIMGYRRATRSLQTSDRLGAREFYALPNGSEIGGIRIVDYQPVYKQRSRRSGKAGHGEVAEEDSR